MRFVLQSLALAIALALLVGCSSELGPAKDFQIVPLDDQAKTVSLKDFKGKVVLLDFWATWCGPCKEAMPEVQALWDKYHSKGFEVASISAEDRQTVLAFHKTIDYTYPVYLDPNGLAAVDYKADQIPTFVLIKDGKIVWQDKGYAANLLHDNVEPFLQ